MKHISLLHTVESVFRTFEGQLQQALAGQELEINSTLDEFFSVDANRKGCFSEENRRRLLYFLQAKDLEHPDLIIVTCSTLTPAVEQIRPFIHAPVLAIDDAMMDEAAATGNHILIMATAASAVEPSRQKLRLAAVRSGRLITISECLCPEAFAALNRQNRKLHDELLGKAADSTDPSVDMIVLAQASMAHMEHEIARRSGRPVLSSPSCCFTRAGQILFGKG